MSKIKSMETDYVYEQNNEYKNIHIKLNVGRDSFILELYCGEIPEEDAVLELLNQLESNMFKMLRISIVRDCKVFICVGEKRYAVKPENVNVVITKAAISEA